MRICDLAKTLGVKSKEIQNFLTEENKGVSYKSSVKKLTEEEKFLVERHFSGSKKIIMSSSEQEEKTQHKKKKKVIILHKEEKKEPTPAVKTIKRKKSAKTETSEEKPHKKVATLIRRKPKKEDIPQAKDVQKTEEIVEQPKIEEIAKVKVDEDFEKNVETVVSEQKETSETTLSQTTVEKEQTRKEIKNVKIDSNKEEIDLEKQQTSSKEEVEAKVDKKSKKENDEKKKEYHSSKKKIIMHPESEKSKTSKKAALQNNKQFKKTRRKIKGVDLNGVIREDDFDTIGKGLKRRKKKDKRKRKEEKVQQVVNPTKAIKKIIKMQDTIPVSELAKKLGVKSSLLIGKLMKLGEMVGINDKLNFDTTQIIADEFGFTVENVALNEDTFIERVEDKPEDLIERPPVVTVMGHVDHGKTKLLDAIRHTNVVDKEAGGITQHIGAYSIEVNGKTITFLDTPGHEAFTAMRSRGAQVTDIVILVVAADDGVMPQTVEAISHAKAADVPIIVAINKIDKPGAEPQRVKTELLQHEIVSEELGGDNLFVEISAKERINIDELLETIVLQYEIMELKANPNKPAEGVVVESKIVQGKGPVATVLVKDGTLKIGDLIVSGTASGYVRSMIDWEGRKVTQATPSMAVEITGLDSVASAGDKLNVFKDEKNAKGLVELRKNIKKDEKFEKRKAVSLENLFSQIEEGEVQDINIIIKADVDGSAEAIIGSLKKIQHDKINLKVIHSGVGGINENDVLLASASNAIIVGFNVRVDNKAKQVAAAESVDIRIFSIIYDLIDSVKSAITGMLSPIIEEEFVGKAEVRQLFKVSKVGTIAGCMVLDGKIVKKGNIKLVRNNVVIYQGTLNSLKRFKDDVKEVKSGYDCGIMVENYNDLKTGDIIECYIDKEIQDKVE